MQIKYIDGIRLQKAVHAGINHVINRKDYLNKINVFPVPDGDTGTNMAYTLSTIANEIKSTSQKPISKMAEAISDASLNGARGNSGSILAQFFVGFSEGSESYNKLNPKRFSKAIQIAKEYSYDALSEPKEGTILSVIKDWADSIHSLQKKHKDFITIFNGALEVAKESLKRTPEQLSVLKNSGVVDAGAQGFIDFLNGIKIYIEEGKLSKVKHGNVKNIEESIVTEVYDEYRYCTECLISGNDIDRPKLKKQLMNLGNSIVLAGSKKKAKVHIHTNEPQSIFTLCSEYGAITGEKADDMLKQQNTAHGKHGETAIIVDSGCDLPEHIIEKFNIHMVPLRFNFGDDHHVDKVTITSDEFWNELQTNPNHPQTSQPTPGDFQRQYQFLIGHYKNAISIHLPAVVSGTLQSAKLAAKSNKKLPIDLIDSENGSIGIGLIAMSAAEAIQKGYDKTKILKKVDHAIKNTVVYIGLNTLDYIVKGGRVSPGKKKLANLFRINPILTFTNDGVKAIGKTFGSKDKIKKFINFVSSKIPSKNFRVGLAHGDDPEMEKIARAHFESLGAKEIISTKLGPALAVHAGPKSLIIALQNLT